MQYRFSGFTFDTDQLVLSRADRVIKLRPKVFDLLNYLVLNRHRVVPKDELFEMIWSRKYVSEATLNSCLKELRKALNDSGRSQQVIRTFHGRGYRFIQEIESIPDASPANSTDEERSAQTPPTPQLFRAGQEYKSVSVVVCGITDVGKASVRLGAETFHRFMQDFFSLVRQCVERYSGTVIRWSEKEFVAVFGAPKAFEDHGRRAVLAALDVRERFTELPASCDPASGIQTGVHTGALVVGGIEGVDEPFYTSVEGTLETASMLRGAAQPGEILVSAVTFSMIHTEFTTERRQQNEQDERPVYSIRAVVQQRAGVPQRQFRGGFVGRDQEIDILAQRHNHAVSGNGQLIAITGEPGIGKTRLITEITRRFKQSGTSVLAGHCLPYATATPYSALLDLARSHCAIDSADTGTAITDKLETALHDADVYSTQAVALLMELFGLDADAESLIGLSSRARRNETFLLLRRLLLTTQRGKPSVLVIEDLHWIDATTEDWLKELVLHLGGLALLLVVTYRPGYQPLWLSHSSLTQLSLPPLSPTDAESLIKSVPRRPALSRRMALDIIDKAQGNPFFLEELTWAFAGTNGQVPDTVQAVLADRIDRLSPEVKHILQVAAVIGAPTPLGLLTSVCAHEDMVVEAAITELQTKEFIYEQGESPERGFVFKHALTQEVAYQTLLSSVREQLHGETLDLIEDRYPEYADQQPAILAHHATVAGRVEHAIKYWQRAGRRAYQRSANIEAIGHLTKGLEILELQPGSKERMQQELMLLTALNPALMAAKGYAATEVEQTCARARDLCERIGEPQQMFRILVGLWNYYWVRGLSETACETGRQLLKLAEGEQNPRHLMRAHAALGEILFHTGQLTAACSHLDKAIALAKSHSEPGERTHVSHVACLCYAAWSHWYLGSIDQSRALGKQALTLAETLQDPLSQSVALCLIAELHQVRAEPKKTKALAEQGVAISRKQGFPFWEGTGLILSGWASSMTGGGETAIEEIQHGLEVFRSTGADVQQTTWLGLLAEAYLQTGMIDLALGTIDEALQWMEKTGERYNEAELYRLKAECLRQSPDKQKPSSIELCYRRAIDVSRGQEARSLELRASTGLADFQKGGKRGR